MDDKIKNVVNDYLEIVAKVLNLLEEKFGKINYILAKNTEQVPKRGFLDNDEMIRYNLHGAGITVDFEDVSIVFDFDFNSNNHFGFNAWQLERFTKLNPEKYPELSKLDYDELQTKFQTVLDELESEGKLEFNQQKDRYYPIEI